MSKLQENKLSLDNEIKSKKIEKENRNLDTKEEKYIVICSSNFIIQNLI